MSEAELRAAMADAIRSRWVLRGDAGAAQIADAVLPVVRRVQEAADVAAEKVRRVEALVAELHDEQWAGHHAMANRVRQALGLPRELP